MSARYARCYATMLIYDAARYIIRTMAYAVTRHCCRRCREMRYQRYYFDIEAIEDERRYAYAMM